MVQDSIWTLVKTGRGDQLNLPYLFFQNYVNCRNQAIYTHNQTQTPTVSLVLTSRLLPEWLRNRQEILGQKRVQGKTKLCRGPAEV